MICFVCKTILALDASDTLLDQAGVLHLTGEDPGMLWCESEQVDGAIPAFIAAIAMHRHSTRDSDPPKI